MLLLKKISLVNFLSHAKTTVNVLSQQKLLISGKSGSGKSSIVDAIIFALYGVGRTDNKSLIKRGAKSASVEVILVDDKDRSIEYIIERTVSPLKNDLKVLEKSGKSFIPVKATGIRGLQEYLENVILCSSYLLFINSIILPQNSTESFVMQTAAKRKDLILEIIKAGDYDEYLKKTKEILQAENIKAEIDETKINIAKNLIVEQQAKADRVSEYEIEDERLKKQAEEMEVEYKQLLAKQTTIAAESAVLLSKMVELSALEETLIKNEEKLRLLNKKIIDLSSLNLDELKAQVAILTGKREELAKLDKEQDQENQWVMALAALMKEAPAERDYDSQIAEINKQIIEVTQELVEKCEKCGTPYPKMEERRQQRLITLQEALAERQKGKIALEASKTAYNSKIALLGPRPAVDKERLTIIKTEIQVLTEFEKKLLIAQNSQIVIDEAIKSIEETTHEQTELKTKKETLQKALEDLGTLKLREEKIQKDLREQTEIKQMIGGMQLENRGRLMIAQDSVANIGKSQKEIEKLTTELKIINDNKEALNALKEAFGPNGIRAIVIDYVIPQLEDRINNVLQKLSDFRVHLDTQKSGAGKDVVLEGLFINIINGEGQELEFSLYSGGERLKIVTAISEALAEIQNIGFRVLDELFIGLDEESVSGFSSVMVELQERFSQMICISHLQQIKDLFEDKITVVKTNGVSQII